MRVEIPPISNQGNTPSARPTGDDGSVPPELRETLARVVRRLRFGSVERLEGPPPEVQREMAKAELASQNLAEQGREVRFETGADGRVSVELTDSAGRSVDVIGPAGLFRLLKLSA
jgi:hypothetical protein